MGAPPLNPVDLSQVCDSGLLYSLFLGQWTMDLGSFFAFKVFVCLAGQTGFSCANRKYLLYVPFGVAWARTLRRELGATNLYFTSLNKKRLKSCSLVRLIFKNLTHSLNKYETLMKK